ncbi:hypothetical protein ANN_09148 [Periplaneta americana]|uniref:Uncharacterized protein n=1 Tax=Periplaneta americana TaxID=6978 RepID=A0ABQ8TKX5_PERAM|nr:hypothetical protein ANN_09148 [Periplaneta americana]
MAADGDCHHLCKLMAPVRHRWSISDVIGGIRNTVMPSDCSPRPVPHGPDLPVPTPPANLGDSESETISLNADTDMSSDPDEFDSSPQKFTQPELNDLDDNNVLSESVMKISYKICHEIAKELKTFNEGEFIKRCLIILADELCPQQVGEVQAIRLSRRTVVKRLQDVRMGYVNKPNDLCVCIERSLFH